MAEREVDRDIWRIVDEAEQTVAHHSWFVEPVDQNPSAELSTSTTRRGDHVHDQRNATAVEISRDHRTPPLVLEQRAMLTADPKIWDIP
jgi:hypothetical protein